MTGETSGDARPTASRAAAHFEQLYAQRADPWDYETSAYEQGKYTATLAALPQARYHSALEIGCSIGVLTARLATRCDQVLAIDYAPTALALARARCRAQPWVTFGQVAVPGEFPSGRFDLILLSEVGYYLSRTDLRLVRARISVGLAPGGHLVLVHWTPPIDDALLTGDEVHEEFLDHGGNLLRHLGGQRAETYRLDLFARRSCP